MTGNLKKIKDSKFLFFVVLFSAAFNFSFLEYNNYLIRKNNPENIERNAKSLVYGQTVFSVDNDYYLSPVDNFLEGKGWKRGTVESNGEYYRRVPGYSIVYLFFTAIFEKPTAFLVLKIFQFFLFLSTIPAIYYLSSQVSGKPVSRLLTIGYAILPFISSWTYYTLTESISPALVVFYFFFLFKALNSVWEKQKLKYYLLASAFFSFAVLTRPYIAVTGLAILLFTYHDFISTKVKKGFLFFSSIWIIPFLLIGSWTLRNYILTKEFVPFEKAFHPQSIDRMKPEFRGLFSFVKCWGEDGFNLTAYHEPLYWAAIAGDTSSKYVINILNAWPEKIIREYAFDRLFGILKEHQELIYSFRSFIKSNKPMPDQYLPEQISMEGKYNGLIREYKRKHVFSYWVVTPLIYLKRMVLHSHTANLYFFQDQNREKTQVNLYRNFLLLVHISIYMCLVLNFLMMRGWTNRLVFIFIPLTFIVFFTVVHREIEQRYMLPVLPVLIAGAAGTLERLKIFAERFKNGLFFKLN
ncbi:MAG TPA: glycosyltransferase family 39 protein [Chitinophagaceae bacterium]|nr:glycosyltransferase family 39 protein [Chitinophagaceae bacterium]